MLLEREVKRPTLPRQSVVKPHLLSHGTTEVRDLKKARRFFEEFLGLDCVQIAPNAIIVYLGLKFHIVCLQTGDRLTKRLNVLNHWGLEVSTPEEVLEAHKKAHELKDVYGILSITTPETVGGRNSFYIEDQDHNFWEIQFYDGVLHDDFTDFGDVTA